jgi:hypothetical protein
MIVMTWGAFVVSFGDAVAEFAARLVAPTRLIIEARVPRPNRRNTRRWLTSRNIVDPFVVAVVARRNRAQRNER